MFNNLQSSDASKIESSATVYLQLYSSEKLRITSLKIAFSKVSDVLVEPVTSSSNTVSSLIVKFSINASFAYKFSTLSNDILAICASLAFNIGVLTSDTETVVLDILLIVV